MKDMKWMKGFRKKRSSATALHPIGATT